MALAGTWGEIPLSKREQIFNLILMLAFTIMCCGFKGWGQSHRRYVPAIVATTTTTTQPPANFTLYYEFDAFTNASGQIVDSSTIGTNIGIPTGCSWVSSSGGTSAYLNLNSYVGGQATNFVLTGTNTNLCNASTITISTWVKQAGLTSTPILSRGASSGSPFTYSFSFDNSTAGAMRFILNVGGTLRIVTSPSLPNNVWVHLAGTYDGSTVKLFTNAVSCGTPVSVSDTLDTTSTLNFYLGRYNDTGVAGDFNLDNVQVYAGDYWTDSEVTNDFNNTKGAHGL